MKQLCLLRHAKSDWSDPALADHDRPLAPRGERAAPVMGRYIAQAGRVPDLVLCSTARRAADTLALAARHWQAVPPVEHDPGLYLCGEVAMRKRLSRLADSVGRVLLVAHNPDLQDLLQTLARGGEDKLLRQAHDKFPTAAFAVIDLPIKSWRDIARTTGTLIDLATPKALV